MPRKENVLGKAAALGHTSIVWPKLDRRLAIARSQSAAAHRAFADGSDDLFQQAGARALTSNHGCCAFAPKWGGATACRSREFIRLSGQNFSHLC